MHASPFKTITESLYDCLSGPAGERDWQRLRTLYHPQARLIRHGQSRIDAADGQVMDLDTYIAGVAPLLRSMDFREWEIEHRAWRFGRVAQVISVYGSRFGSGREASEGRGVNFIQLQQQDDGHWLVTSIIWDNERPGLELETFPHTPPDPAPS